jgi:hypothetical protein
MPTLACKAGWGRVNTGTSVFEVNHHPLLAIEISKKYAAVESSGRGIHID